MVTRAEVIKLIKETSKIDLGSPPWPEEALSRAYFRNFTQTRAVIKVHPGHVFHRDLEDLKNSLEFLLDTVATLESACQDFRNDAVVHSFWYRVNANNFDRRVQMIRKALFTAAAAAMAMVENYRAVVGHVKPHDYDRLLEEQLRSWPPHRFIQSLRGYLSHRRLLDAHWKVKWAVGSTSQETRFYLRQEDLELYKEWNVEAREYMKQNPDGIDPETLFRAYIPRVDAFYRWFSEAFVRAADPALTEYRGYANILDRLGSRSEWGVIIQAAIQGGIDPYQYLDRHLTPQELADVYQFPNHSADQVNRIIAILDTHRACDDTLRAKVFALFEVKSATLHA